MLVDGSTFASDLRYVEKQLRLGTGWSWSGWSSIWILKSVSHNTMDNMNVSLYTLPAEGSRFQAILFRMCRRGSIWCKSIAKRTWEIYRQSKHRSGPLTVDVKALNKTSRICKVMLERGSEMNASILEVALHHQIMTLKKQHVRAIHSLGK